MTLRDAAGRIRALRGPRLAGVSLCPYCGRTAVLVCAVINGRIVLRCFDLWACKRAMAARPVSAAEVKAEVAKWKAEADAQFKKCDALEVALIEAESDAKVLAHAYTHDNRPPDDIVARALAYKAGVPA